VLSSDDDTVLTAEDGCGSCVLGGTNTSLLPAWLLFAMAALTLHRHGSRWAR
jgi:hypothetical protein